MRTLGEFVVGEELVVGVVERLVMKSMWFEVDPWPGVEWEVRVKAEAIGELREILDEVRREYEEWQ